MQHIIILHLIPVVLHLKERIAEGLQGYRKIVFVVMGLSAAFIAVVVRVA